MHRDVQFNHCTICNICRLHCLAISLFQFNHCTINSIPYTNFYKCYDISIHHCTINRKSNKQQSSLLIFQFNHCTINRRRIIFITRFNLHFNSTIVRLIEDCGGLAKPHPLISIQPLYD